MPIDGVSNDSNWSKNLVDQLFALSKDKRGISADVWNGFLDKIGSKGNHVTSYIPLNKAAKSFEYYNSTKDKGSIDWENNWQTLFGNYTSKATEESAQAQSVEESQAPSEVESVEENPNPPELTGEMRIQSAAQKPSDGLYTYTVQANESYTELMKKVLHAQGIANPTPQQITDMKNQFQADNPGAVRKTKKGVEFLLVGSSVKLRADIGDRQNSAEQIDAYKFTVGYKPFNLTKSKFVYDANGNPVKVIRDNGMGEITDENTFDSNGNLLTTVTKNASGDIIKTIEHTYDSNGNITNYTKKDPSGGVKEEVTFTYDSSGKVAKREIKNSLGTIVIDYNYDSSGHTTSVVQNVNGAKATTDEFEYDSNGNCTKWTMKNKDDKVTQTQEQQYSPNGELETVIEGSSARFDFLYDSNGRIIQIIERKQDTGEIWGITNHKYDVNGNKISSEGRGGFRWRPTGEEWMNPTYRYTKECYQYYA